MTGVRAILFDLDGTLIDSAPDLAGAANDLLQAHGRPALPFERLRPVASSGARGLVGVTFGVGPGDDRYEPLRLEFLAIYESRLTRLTHVFDAVHPMLEAIEAAGLPWGIVTNKAGRYTDPIVAHLGLDRRAGVVISGDTTPHAKPHPEPLFEAARRMAVDAEACVYVGDDLRDIQAGRAASMRTLAAAWGYLGHGEPVHAWGADAVITEPNELLNWLRKA
jgi:N-acetyl-D-muramate 6-phosphate phosphatase